MRMTAISTVFLLTLSSNISFGQGGFGGFGQPEQPDHPAFDKKFDLDFPGGTLADLKAALQSEIPELNLIAKDAQEVQIHPIELRNVGIKSVLDLLGEVSDPRVDCAEFNREDLIYEVYLSAPRPTQTAPDDMQVFTLGPLLKSDPNLTIEDVLSVIESTIELQEAQDPKSMRQEPEGMPRLKYHETTGLLIVAAPQRKLLAIKQVITAIQQGQDVNNLLAKTAMLIKENDELINRFKDEELRNQDLQDKVTRLTEIVSKLEQQIKSGENK